MGTPEMIIIWIITGLIVGTICAVIANGRGHNAIGWFFIGFASGFFGSICLGWIPILIVSTISNKKEQQYLRSHLDRENRRLREQIQRSIIALPLSKIVNTAEAR